MKVLVIPDSHLQAWVFHAADKLMEIHNFDHIVVLGDILDSHNNGNDLFSYSTMLDTCIEFIRKYKDKLTWLWGNHEISYIEPECLCSGHVFDAEPLVDDRLCDLIEALNAVPSIVTRIDSVFFSHAGIADSQVICRDWDGIVKDFNNTRYKNLWYATSPIWYRPSLHIPYQDYGCFQIAGHTPTVKPFLYHNLLLVDTIWEFNGAEGASLFPVVDTVTHEVVYYNKNNEKIYVNPLES